MAPCLVLTMTRFSILAVPPEATQAVAGTVAQSAALITPP
jgi:hypothetical protein